MMRLIGLQDEVRRLRRSKGRAENEQRTISKAIREAPARIENYSRAIKQATQDAEHLQRQPSFQFRTHTGTEIVHTEEGTKKALADARRDARAAYEEAQAKAIERYSDNTWAREGYQGTGKLGSYKGFELSVSRDGKHTITTPSDRKIPYGGSFDSLEKVINAIPKHPVTHTENLAAFQRDLERLRKSEGQPFKKAQLLEERERELATLTSQRNDKKALRESPDAKTLLVNTEESLTSNLERMKSLGLRISTDGNGLYNIHDAGDTIIAKIRYKADGK
jgi:hypothetical protein